MPQLTKQMYKASRSFSNPAGLFGLREDQMVGGIHNAGWYNGHGEFLGYGDIDFSQIKKIMAEIDPNEVFVILAEYDWRMKFHPELYLENGYQHVPVNFLARHGMFFIRRGDLHVRVFSRGPAPGSQGAHAVADWGACVKLVTSDEQASRLLA